MVTGTREDHMSGLSPRVRGNLATHDARMKDVGSIPACAGEPLVSLAELLLLSVYPRVCGGTGAQWMSSAYLIGLSPRVRGNRCKIVRGAPPQRSIPACAGEPSLHPASHRQRQVYPRVCGGTTVLKYKEQFDEGLSPRVRGNPIRLTYGCTITRSIPACAGGTLRDVAPTRSASGLSPRVRGNRFDISIFSVAERSIPACAGEPSLVYCYTKL